MSSDSPRAKMIDWVQTYLDVGIQSSTPSTRKAPRQVLLPFAEWYDRTRRHPRRVSRDDLVRFFLKEGSFAGKIAPSTHNQYRVVLRQFLTWAMATERLPTKMPLLEAITRQAPKRRNFVRITDVQMAEMINNCTNLRNAALLAANFHHLARSSEMKALRLGDIDLDQQVIDWYNIKKSRPIRKRIPPQLDRALRAWISAYTGGAVALKDVDGLPMVEWHAFPRRTAGRGETYCPGLPIGDTVGLIQQYTVPIIGRVKYDGASHMGRRSGARALKENLVRRGMDPGSARTVTQAMLDHQSPETTDRYTDDSLAQALAYDAMGEDFLPDLNNVTKLRSVGGVGSEAAV